MVTLDQYFYKELAPSSRPIWPDVVPLVYVGPGCPQYFADIAYGYSKRKRARAEGMTYAVHERECFESFLEHSEEALHAMPLYRFLRERQLIPEILASQLECIGCELRKPRGELVSKIVNRTTQNLQAAHQQKLRVYMKHAALKDKRCV